MRTIFEIAHKILDKYLHQVKIIMFLKYSLNFKYKTIFDVGSHKGESIDLFLRLNSNIKLYCFEPQIKLFKHLKKKYKSKKNIILHNFAFGSKKEKKKLTKNIFSSSSSFSKINFNSKHSKLKEFILKKGNAGFYKSELVDVQKLDAYCKKNKIKNIDIVKIDTEGHEFDVLSGFANSIKMVKIIIIEQTYTNYYKNYNVNKITKYLVNKSFIPVKKFKFPFMQYYDCVYINKKFTN
jgi:FkbM family methyltransferase